MCFSSRFKLHSLFFYLSKRVLIETPILVHRRSLLHTQSFKSTKKERAYRIMDPQPDERGSIPLQTLSPAGREGEGEGGRAEQPSSGTITQCQQIHKEIDSGSYECGICFEPVNRQCEIWHCDSCWRIYHHACIVDCARGTQRRDGEVPSVAFGREWKCPSCRDEYEGPPIQTCCESWPPKT